MLAYFCRTSTHPCTPSNVSCIISIEIMCNCNHPLHPPFHPPTYTWRFSWQLTYLPSLMWHVLCIYGPGQIQPLPLLTYLPSFSNVSYIISTGGNRLALWWVTLDEHLPTSIFLYPVTYLHNHSNVSYGGKYRLGAGDIWRTSTPKYIFIYTLMYHDHIRHPWVHRGSGQDLEQSLTLLCPVMVILR